MLIVPAVDQKPTTSAWQKKDRDIMKHISIQHTPVIAIVGRPNVGKSTLFNCLSRSKQAIVADYPGLTRDRQYAECHFNNLNYWIIDTGGIDEHTDDPFQTMSQEQIDLALEEADLIFFVVDAKQGLTPQDQHIASILRKRKQPVLVLVNKIDGQDPDQACSDFFGFGMSDVFGISAQQGRNIRPLLSTVFDHCSIEKQEETTAQGIKFACIGRPNVGKSTLANRLLGENRVLVSDVAGTTRDSIMIPFEHHGQSYTLIDTAGIRRRAKIREEIEQFSIVQSIKSIDMANVVMFLLDAKREISEQDCQLLSLLIKRGCPLVLVVNKWDNLSQEDKLAYKMELKRRTPFVDCAKPIFISALYGSAVGHLYEYIHQAHQNQQQAISTALLTKLLKEATTRHPPPMSRGRRIRLRYAHVGGRRPFTIVVHGKQTAALAQSYQRYLLHFFRKHIQLDGIPLHLKCISDDNPYASDKN